jgi:hypothetical protein
MDLNRDAYIDKAEATYNELKAKVDKKIADVKIEKDKREAKQELDEARHSLDELKQASKDEWDKLSRKLESTMTKIRASLE